MESFKTLYLSTCKKQNITPSESVMHILKQNKHYDGGRLALQFSGCNLTTGDCDILAKCFATDRNIEEYRFTDCLLNEDASKIILSALSFNKKITVLDLKGNNIRLSGSLLVGKLLKRTTTLEELYLEWNTLGMWDEGITAMAEGLALNQSLRILNLSNNQISHENGQQLATALKRNKNLRKLDLRWNNIGVLGGRAFVSALAQNKYIIELSLAGNNIPGDTMKAIATATQRNIDYYSIYEEHQSMAMSFKQEIDHLQLEKSLQVSTLMNQLEKEKEIHENMTETTRDHLEEMKVAIDELRKENKYLRIKKEEQEKVIKTKSAELAENIMKNEGHLELQKKLKQENADKVNEITETLHMERKLKQKEDLEKEGIIFDLQNNTKELKQNIVEHLRELDTYQNLMKKQNGEHDAHVSKLNSLHKKEIEELIDKSKIQEKTLQEKIVRLEKEKEYFEGEVSKLKSNALSEKLKFDEDMMTQRSRWKQDEALKTKHYEDRIDLLISTKDDLQSKISQLSVQVSECQAQLFASKKDCEGYKKQVDQHQQLLTQKDYEHRNESNRLKTEIDSEKRINSDLKDQTKKLENQMHDLKSQANELKSSKDIEIANLQTQIKSKEDDLKRMRDEEMRRATVVENALQTYLSSIRTAYK